MVRAMYLVPGVLWVAACAGQPQPEPAPPQPTEPAIADSPAPAARDEVPVEQDALGERLRKLEYRYGMQDDVIAALKGKQLTLRALAADWLGRYGTVKAVPPLIEALSDPTVHVGANYPDPGRATTRHRAKLALKQLTGEDFGFVWNGPMEERQRAVAAWRAWLDERDAVIEQVRDWLAKRKMTRFDVYRVHLNADKAEWGASLTEDPPRPGAPVLIVDRKTHAIRLIPGR